MSDMILTAAIVEQLARDALELGLMRLGVASLADPRLHWSRKALDRFAALGREGEMGFLSQTHHLRKHPEQLLEGAKTALVVAVPYRGEPGPVARYAQWHDYHTVIHSRLLALGRCVEGYLPNVRTLVCVDTKPVPERALAEIAGLGFIGKNGCVIVPGLGSFVLLGALLCTADVASDVAPEPPVFSPPGSPSPDPLTDPQREFAVCGTCTACLDACPTQAFDSPGDLDPRRCISYLTIEHRNEIADELAQKMGARVAGCDVCQDVCPHNQSRLREDRVPAPAWLPPPPNQARDRTPDLLRLLDVGNNQHRGFVRHTPLSRIPRRSLRRNAALALAHVDLDNAEIDARLQRVVEAPDTDPVLRSAAQWALGHRTRVRDHSQR